MYGPPGELTWFTLPTVTESTSCGLTLAACRAELVAITARSIELVSLSLPPNVPIARSQSLIFSLV